MWDLLLNDEQKMIADAIRGYVAGELPIERLRPNGRLIDQGAALQGMAALGWFGVGLPESVGGAGLGLVEEALIQRECGRFLVPTSALATVLAGHAAVHASDSALAKDLVAGKASVALAIDAAPAARRKQRSAYALDWNGQDPLLLWNDAGMGLFEGTDPQAMQCLDDSVTLHFCRLRLDRPRLWVPAETKALARRADVLLAAALAGLAEHACDLAVDYAKVREQFGRPIGSFQAVKHRCADMAVRWRLGWFQILLAGLKVEAGAADAPLQVASAKLLAAEAAHENGRAGIQIHGAIGFQSECDAHWFVKRAHVYDQLGGTMAEQARRVIVAPTPGW